MEYDREFVIQVQYFLVKIRREGIHTENKKKLYQIVQQLENRTEKQKNRFLCYYGLVNDYNEGKITLKDLATKEGCIVTTVRNSIVRIINAIDNIKDEGTKKALLEIMNEEMKK